MERSSRFFYLVGLLGVCAAGTPGPVGSESRGLVGAGGQAEGGAAQPAGNERNQREGALGQG